VASWARAGFPGGWARVATAAAFAAVLLASCARHDAAPPEPARLIGSIGRQPGQFSKPRAVAVSQAGELVVVDRSGRVQVLDLATGKYLRKWSLPAYANGTPTGVSMDPNDDTLWVADTHYQRILHYDLNGRLLHRFGTRGTDPGQMIFPTDVCPSPDGRTLWVTEFGLRCRVMRFTREGAFLGEWGSGEYEYEDVERAQAAVAAPDGRIFVADAGRHRVLIFNAEGEPVGSWGEPGEAPGQLSYPYDLAFDGEGMLYICEYGNSRISRFSPDGRFLGSWGVPGYRPGELFTPWGVAVAPNGAVVVADTNNSRIQVLDHPAQAFAKAGAT